MSKNQKKILYVLHWFPALSETFILREILELQKLGDRVDVATIYPPPDNVQHAEFDQFDGTIINSLDNQVSDFKAHLYWLWWNPGAYFSVLFTILSKFTHAKTLTVSLKVFTSALKITYLLRDSDYRHIHSHFANHAATGAWIVSKFLNVPFSFTAHAIGIFVPDMLLHKKLEDASFVSVISHFNINYILERYPDIDKNKFHIIRCGVRTDEFSFSPAKEVNTPARLLSVGRIVEKKGYPNLIKAVKLVIDGGKDIHLTIIGSGELTDDMKSLAEELKITDKIYFAGPQPSDKVLQSMKMSDLFVLSCAVTSRGDRDGIPVVLMESLALGVPTITTEVSGIPELIINFETGLVVPPEDPKLLADAILLYLSEKDLRKRLPLSGRRLVESEFNVEVNAAKLANLFTPER